MFYIKVQNHCLSLWFNEMSCLWLRFNDTFRGWGLSSMFEDQV
jgi:hypothetical protein